MSTEENWNLHLPEPHDLKESLKKIIQLLHRKDRIKLVVVFGMMLLAALLEVIGIGMIPVFVLAVSDPESLLGYPVLGSLLQSLEISTSLQLIVYGGVLLIGIYLLKKDRKSAV